MSDNKPQYDIIDDLEKISHDATIPDYVKVLCINAIDEIKRLRRGETDCQQFFVTLNKLLQNASK